MVKVGVADQDVVDLGEFFERKISNPRACIDQHIVVNQKGCGSASPGDRAGAAEDADFHVCLASESR